MEEMRESSTIYAGLFSSNHSLPLFQSKRAKTFYLKVELVDVVMMPAPKNQDRMSKM